MAIQNECVRSIPFGVSRWLRIVMIYFCYYKFDLLSGVADLSESRVSRQQSRQDNQAD